MHRLIAHFDQLAANAAGVTILEYAFIASIISIAAAALWTTIGGWLAGVFGTIAGAL